MFSVIAVDQGFRCRVFGPVSRHGPGSCFGFQVEDPGDAAFARENKQSTSEINTLSIVNRQVRNSTKQSKAINFVNQNVTDVNHGDLFGRL